MSIINSPEFVTVVDCVRTVLTVVYCYIHIRELFCMKMRWLLK